MKRIICFFLSLFVLAGMAGCKQFEVMDPEIDSAVYLIDDLKSGVFNPNQDITFKYLPIGQQYRLLTVRVGLSGDVSSEPRRVPFEQVMINPSGWTEDHNAVPLPADKDLLDAKAFEGGTVEAHYVAFDHPKMMDFLTLHSIYGIGEDRDGDGFTDLDKLTNVAFVDPTAPYHNEPNSNPNGTPLQYPVLLLRDPSLDPSNPDNPQFGRTDYGEKIVGYEEDEDGNLILDNKGNPIPINEPITAEEYYLNHPWLLRMTLVPNNDFILARNDRVAHFITIRDVWSKPSTWDKRPDQADGPYYWSWAFGEWSSRKMDIIRLATGFNNWELDNPKIDMPYSDEMGAMKRDTRDLLEWMRENEPDDVDEEGNGVILDENRKPITLP